MSDNFFAELDSELGHVPKSEPSEPRPVPMPAAPKAPTAPHFQKPKPQLKPTTPMVPGQRPTTGGHKPVPKKPLLGKPVIGNRPVKRLELPPENLQ